MKKASKNSTYKKVNRFSTEIDAFILVIWPDNIIYAGNSAYFMVKL